MIEFEEHIYDDDPCKGHPDGRTNLPDSSYFFIGNGLIQAAVQYSPAGEGSPYGLLIMDPDRLKRKNEALSFDTETGLESTMLAVQEQGKNNKYSVIEFDDLTAEWDNSHGFPAVSIIRSNGIIRVEELFYCSGQAKPELIREIRIENKSDSNITINLQTGLPGKLIDDNLSLPKNLSHVIYISYGLVASENKYEISIIAKAKPDKNSIGYWKSSASLSIRSSSLDHYFRTSAHQLRAMVSASGKIDASIWQYNREWVRDHSMMCIGLILAGHRQAAGILLQRLLNDFVSAAGDTIDSGERRCPDDVELDQNGALLYATETYYLWTGDKEFIMRNWPKLSLTADFLLDDAFRHKPSGLLHNKREYWERHSAHGIEAGMELAYQVYAVKGLRAAVAMAKTISKENESKKWQAKADEIWGSVINHQIYSLVGERGFIKRRGINGNIQEMIDITEKADLPDGVPLKSAGIHYLNPDTSTALPIALGLITPGSETAKSIIESTMESIENLWNQKWSGGGYGRYNISSEPDSPGPWTFPSLFIARAYVELGQSRRVQRVLDWLGSLSGSLSGTWHEFYGHRISPPFPQTGIPPWTWAEIITLTVHHILGIRPEREYIRIRPRLLPGMDEIMGSFPIRDIMLHLNIKADSKISEAEFEANVDLIEENEGEVLIPYTKEDVSLKIILPKEE